MIKFVFGHAEWGVPKKNPFESQKTEGVVQEKSLNQRDVFGRCVHSNSISSYSMV